jgi:hypothetical protein
VARGFDRVRRVERPVGEGERHEVRLDELAAALEACPGDDALGLEELARGSGDPLDGPILEMRRWFRQFYEESD